MESIEAIKKGKNSHANEMIHKILARLSSLGVGADGFGGSVKC